MKLLGSKQQSTPHVACRQQPAMPSFSFSSQIWIEQHFFQFQRCLHVAAELCA
jgi:hypothetical protein